MIKFSAPERRYIDDLHRYVGVATCEYQQLVKNKIAAIRKLVIVDGEQEIKVSRNNWVEVGGFCFTGITYEVLKEIIDTTTVRIEWV